MKSYKATAIHYHVLVERNRGVFLKSLKDLQLLNRNTIAQTGNLSICRNMTKAFIKIIQKVF